MLVFVYGTLRQGQRNHHFLKDCAFYGKAQSQNKFKIITRSALDYPEGYPVAIPDESGSPLSGELYEISEDVLKHLDILEDYPHEYDRQEFLFSDAHGHAMKAWMYFGKDE